MCGRCRDFQEFHHRSWYKPLLEPCKFLSISQFHLAFRLIGTLGVSWSRTACSLSAMMFPGLPVLSSPPEVIALEHSVPGFEPVFTLDHCRVGIDPCPSFSGSFDELSDQRPTRFTLQRLEPKCGPARVLQDGKDGVRPRSVLPVMSRPQIRLRGTDRGLARLIALAARKMS